MNNYIFESQFKQEIILQAEKLGVRIAASKSFQDVLLDFLTVRLKLIDIIPRDAIMSPPLLKKIFFHTHKKEIETIFKYAKTGQNLNQFQSKRILQSRFHDHLSNEWNIYHFHLSFKRDLKSSFVKQVDMLLFAYIDNKKIIFLDIAKHTPGIFADTKWIEILHDYFPEIIEPFEANNMSDVFPKLNPQDRQTLWDTGYTVGLTKIRDKVYFSPGAGRMTSGHGIGVIETSNRICRWMHKLDTQILESINELCIYLRTTIDKIDFAIRFGEENLELVEMSTKTKILTFDEVLILKEEIIRQCRS